MKKLKRILALALLATVAVQAMDNQQPQTIWKDKIKEKAKQLMPGPGKLALAVYTIGACTLRTTIQETLGVGPIAMLGIPPTVVLALNPKMTFYMCKDLWKSKWSFQNITPQTQTSKTEQCPVCYDTKPVIQLNCHTQHFICPDCFEDLLKNGFTKCLMCQKEF